MMLGEGDTEAEEGEAGHEGKDDEGARRVEAFQKYSLLT